MITKHRWKKFLKAEWFIKLHVQDAISAVGQTSRQLLNRIKEHRIGKQHLRVVILHHVITSWRWMMFAY